MILEIDKKEFDLLEQEELEVVYACYMLKSMERDNFLPQVTRFNISEDAYQKCEKMEDIGFTLSQETMYDIFQELESLGLLKGKDEIKSMMAKG